jgi:hypothetical protein
VGHQTSTRRRAAATERDSGARRFLWCGGLDRAPDRPQWADLSTQHGANLHMSCDESDSTGSSPNEIEIGGSEGMSIEAWADLEGWVGRSRLRASGTLPMTRTEPSVRCCLAPHQSPTAGTKAIGPFLDRGSPIVPAIAGRDEGYQKEQ